ncbi:DJ-1/PfpI family protein [Dactylosporangium sp. NPDC000555]|uniref:DJ-1/PfpI family protein n=1 Tax=Dactylosporangium sp. NPDC000555 TaxID=3154260 RepID=UPI0033188850
MGESLYAYVYVLDTLADWELGHVLAELNTGQYAKAGRPAVPVRTVAATTSPVTTMGGLTIVPQATVDDVTAESTAVLLLPGANQWREPQHAAILHRACRLLDAGVTVAAICGATGALAELGALDRRRHTSNSLDYLKLTSTAYRGERSYVEERAVADGNLITAGAAGGLDLARLVIERLDLFAEDTLDAWHRFYATADARHFLDLLDSLPQSAGRRPS